MACHTVLDLILDIIVPQLRWIRGAQILDELRDSLLGLILTGRADGRVGPCPATHDAIQPVISILVAVTIGKEHLGHVNLLPCFSAFPFAVVSY
jgi:hypothetical protein